MGDIHPITMVTFGSGGADVRVQGMQADVSRNMFHLKYKIGHPL